MPAEEWKQVQNFPEVEVSSFGRVRKTVPTSWHRVKVEQNQKGNVVVTVGSGHDTTRNYRFRLDKAVAFAFISSSPDYMLYGELIHIDGDPKNCRASNLRWE